MTFIRTLFMLGALVLFSQPALSQKYPDKPLRLIVPFSAGGVTDLVARIYASELGKSLGQTVVVENKTGAAGAVAMDAVKQAAADGYTLMLATIGTQAINPALIPTLRYSPNDLDYVTMLTTVPQLLVVNASSPIHSVAELVDHAKKNPGTLSYGSSGIGSAPHLAVEIFSSRAGFQAVHVPYRGSSQSITDLIAGRLDFMIDPVTTTLPYVQAGKLRALAVSTPERLAVLPDLPTIAESGYPDYDVGVWNTIAVRKGTPRAVIERLASDSARILSSEQIRKRLQDVGAVPFAASPEESQAFVAREQSKYKQIVRDANLKAE
ncbi:Bug family tripartite tricarboxylate transporter substrate binding protein [Advenella mimigardefordensis]|uniref:Putative Bug-like extracytoplasmic solute binding receptor, TTT family n=1 Tax=Advenella mimigardefordensis (strain DSM 17166 / LMG 22922 / DPN7) TaxID=1247726 RepID=W0P5W8_ADVMD|nr:tripartite tricarboxylate transporter substrate binding protein [Advenella mimigardefordensis]AHG62151.1 putative Bug-like extracytoplasmic solute binding receptor, TTT family [Advenella mimigardefordensis DPN7]